MNHPCCLRIVVMALPFYAIVAQSAVAQQSEIRLSGDIYQFSLPKEIQIEAVAELNTTTLAVWGNTVKDGDSARGVLFAYVFLNHYEKGDWPYEFSSREARPSGWVQVIALRDRYLVLWNDRRAGPTVGYVSLVDTMGKVLTEEKLGYDEKVAAPQVFVVQRRAGYRLFWNAGDVPQLRWRDLDDSGRFVSPAIPEAHAVQRIYAARARTDTAYVDFGDSIVYRVELEANRWVPFRLPRPGTISIRSDGAAIACDGDSVHFYRTCVDSIPKRSVYAGPRGSTTILRTAFYNDTGQAILADYRLVAESTDRWLIATLTCSHHDIDSNGNQTNAWIAQTVRDTVADQPSYTVPRVIVTQPITVARWCACRLRATTRIEVYYTDWWGQKHVVSDMLELALDGEYTLGGSRPIDSVATCLRRLKTYPLIERTYGNNSESSVSVGWYTEKKRWYPLVRKKGKAFFQMPELSPILTMHRGDAIVTFICPGTIDSVLRSMRWFALAYQRADAIYSLNYYDAYPRPDVTVLAGAGDETLGIFQSSVGSTLYRPTQAGRVDLLSFYTGDPLVKAFTDPDDGRVLVAQGRVLPQGAIGSLKIFFLDSLNRELQRYSAFPGSTGRFFSPVPLRDSSYVIADQYGLTVYRGGELVNRLPYATKTLERRYRPISGDRFLAWYLDSGAVNVEVYDDSLEIQNRYRQYVNIASVWDVSVVQNALDSGFGVVYGNSAGLFVSQLDRDLVPRLIGYRMSATSDTASGPSATYSRGILIVAWRSLRGGVVDIYGTTFPPPASVRDPSTSAEGVGTVAIVYSDADESVSVQFPRPLECNGIYRLVDVQGRTIRTVSLSTGDTSFEVSTSDLLVGWYLLSLHIGETSFAQPIIVMR